MNNIHALATMDWQGNVPSLEGDFSHDNLANLQSILEKIKNNKDTDSQQVYKKCINFTKSISDAKEYYLASSIFAKNFNVKPETVEFKDGPKKVFNYQLTALEKDFPGKDIRKLLKNMPAADFESILNDLYSPVSNSSKDDAEVTVAFLRKYELYNPVRINKAFGLKPEIEEHDYSRFEVDDVIQFLNGDVELDDDEIDLTLERAIDFVENMDPTNRQDVKKVVEISKALSDIDPENNTTLATLKKEIDSFVQTSVGSQRNLSVFERFISVVASFLGKSVEHWLPVDEAFLNENLKDMGKIAIIAPDNASDEFKNWANSSSVVVLNKDIDWS